MFVGWYDPDKKKSSHAKLTDAIRRYQQKHDEAPQVALINIADFEGNDERDDIDIRVVGHVAPSTFFVGVDEPDLGVLS